MKIKNKRKNNKGITLVSLVITIIIMLIIAGVSMKLIFTEDGVIDSAEDASKKPEKVQTIQLARKEILKLGVENSREANFEEAMNIIKKYDKNQTIKKYGEDDAYIITNKENKILVSEIWKGRKTDLNPGVLEGSGTVDDPYVVNSIEDFIFLSLNVNKGNSYRGQTIVLGMDIDFDGDSYVDENAKYSKDGKFGYVRNDNSNTTLKELLTTGEGFIPIGIDGASAYFEGNFNGNGHYIANIYENSTTFGGLFGYISSNVNISNLEIKSGTITGENLVGAIVGEGQSTNMKIINCVNYATITAKQSSNGHVGGIVGHTTGLIQNCENYGQVSGYRYAGGVIGCAENRATIVNCYNCGKIQSFNHAAGGIAGGGEANIRNCYNEANVTGYEYTGGIVGMLQNSTITNCYNSGQIQSTNNSAGGIVGNGSANLNNCYNIGNVKASVLASGVSASESGTCTNCYNKGNVSTTSNWATAAGIGIYGSCINCYNSGKMQGPSYYSLYEIANATLNNCYYLNRNDGTNVNANGAIAKSQSEMNVLMKLDDFISLMNSYVSTNNSNSSNVQLKTWKYEDNIISFE